MRFIARSTLIAILVGGLLNLPAMAAAEKPLGMVVQAQSARLEAMAAAVGATVYPGDAVDTDPNGTLRLKVGNGQIYLMGNTEVRFAEIDQVTQATLNRGTVAFSTSPADRFQLETPVGIIQPAEGPVYGQVAITGPEQMIISAFKGDLILDYNGDVHTIAGGSSYKVDLEPGPPPQRYGVTRVTNKHLVIKLIAIGAVAAIIVFTWRELAESPSKYSD